MKNTSTFKIVSSALFCALVFVGTFISIPTPPFGNVNLGDAFVLIGGYLLGPYAIIACPLGASLCDLASGYTIYAPATFIIKALMVCSIILNKKYLKKVIKNQTVFLVISFVIAELIMALGYLGYEFILYDLSALANVPFNLVQGAINTVVAIVLMVLLTKLKVLDKYKDK